MKLQINRSQKFNWLGDKLGEKHLNGTINGSLCGTIKKLKEKRGSKKASGYFVKFMEVKL